MYLLSIYRNRTGVLTTRIPFLFSFILYIKSDHSLKGYEIYWQKNCECAGNAVFVNNGRNRLINDEMRKIGWNTIIVAPKSDNSVRRLEQRVALVWTRGENRRAMWLKFHEIWNKEIVISWLVKNMMDAVKVALIVRDWLCTYHDTTDWDEWRELVMNEYDQATLAWCCALWGVSPSLGKKTTDLTWMTFAWRHVYWRLGLTDVPGLKQLNREDMGFSCPGANRTAYTVVYRIIRWCMCSWLELTTRTWLNDRILVSYWRQCY